MVLSPQPAQVGKYISTCAAAILKGRLVKRVAIVAILDVEDATATIFIENEVGEDGQVDVAMLFAVNEHGGRMDKG